MTARKAIFGLCAICALLFSAVAAQGASAAGATAVTCKAGTGFSDSLCTTAASPGTFGHTAIAPGQVTEITGSAAGNSILKAKFGGANVILTSTSLSGSGTMVNEEVGGEMIARGTGTILYENVTANHGCKVFADPGGSEMGAEGSIKTETLKATTQGLGTAGLRFEPNGATPFAKFWLTNCEAGFEALNTTWEVTGSIIGIPHGATTVFTHAEGTTQGTLKSNGIVSGLEGTLKIAGRVSGSGGAYTPLALT